MTRRGREPRPPRRGDPGETGARTLPEPSRVDSPLEQAILAHDALAVICLDPSIREWLAGSDPKALEQADAARLALREALYPQAAEQHALASMVAGGEETASVDAQGGDRR